MRDSFTAILDEADFVDSFRPEPRRGRKARLTLFLALFLAALIVVLLVLEPHAGRELLRRPLFMALVGAVALAAGLVIALLIAAPSLRRRAARMTLEHHPGMRDPISYVSDPEHFSMRSPYVQAQYPWEELWDWRETDRIVMVLPTPRNFYVIPKRSIDEAVLERLRARLGKARRRSGAGKAKRLSEA